MESCYTKHTYTGTTYTALLYGAETMQNTPGRHWVYLWNENHDAARVKQPSRQETEVSSDLV